MKNLILRRILIVVFLIVSLITIELATTETMLLNTPTEEDVFQSLIDRNNQREQLQNEITQRNIRDDKEEYQLLFDNSVRHTFIIRFTQEEWDGLITDMETYYDLYGSYRSNNYRRVDITYIRDDVIYTIDEVGFSSKGNTYSRRPPIDDEGNIRPVHFKLKFNETFDYQPKTERYEQLKTREEFDVERLIFKWNNQEDPSFTNEVFAYEMFKQVDVFTPEATYAEVQYVVDSKLVLTELYNIFEHFDEEFIRKNIQDEPTKKVGDLYKAIFPAPLVPIYSNTWVGVRNWETNYRPTYGKETNQELDSHENLILFTYGINYENKIDRYNYIQENFAVDMFLRAMAMNVLLGNPDDYRANLNNYYLYFDKDDYCYYIPFDYDNSLGVGWSGEPAFTNYTLSDDIYQWGIGFPWHEYDAVLWENIIEYEEYQIMYEDYLMEFIDEDIYSVDSYNELFNQTYNLYSDTFPTLQNDRAGYIAEKIRVVTEQVEFYRLIR